MTTSAAPRRHLASSPFKPDPEPTIEHYEVDDLVSHDSYGMGRVLHVEGAAVTLSGAVATHLLAKDAEAAAWAVPGVTTVRNLLKVG